MPSLDVLDDLDRRIVVALQQDGRASWSTLAKTCESSVPTVARRTQRLLDEGVIRITVIPALGNDGPVESFFTWIKCHSGRQLEVASILIDRDDVRFAALVTGGADILAEVVLPRASGLQAKEIIALSAVDGIQSLTSDLLPHVYKISHDWSRQILDPVSKAVDSAPPTDCDPSHFDDQDREVTALLRDDGRKSFREVAQETGINESTVRRRFDRLRSQGCISVVTLVSAAALGLESEANIAVRIEPKHISDAAATLAKKRSVRYLAATLSESSLLCEVITGSTQELHSFITDTLARIEGVHGWTACLELLTLKRGFVQTARLPGMTQPSVGRHEP